MISIQVYCETYNIKRNIRMITENTKNTLKIQLKKEILVSYAQYVSYEGFTCSIQNAFQKFSNVSQ